MEILDKLAKERIELINKINSLMPRAEAKRVELESKLNYRLNCDEGIHFENDLESAVLYIADHKCEFHFGIEMMNIGLAFNGHLWSNELLRSFYDCVNPTLESRIRQEFIDCILFNRESARKTLAAL